MLDGSHSSYMYYRTTRTYRQVYLSQKQHNKVYVAHLE